MNKSLPKANVQAHPLNSEQPNTGESEIPLNLPPFKKYTKNDLEFNIFSPKEGLFYFFISELTEPNSFILDQSSNTLFDLKYCSDIQRFCYYPGTKNIYTFFGFQKEDQRSKSMKNKKIISSSYEHIITQYPIQEIPPKKRPKKIEKNKKKQQQEKPTELSKFNEDAIDDSLEFADFIPKNNLVYLFFAESSKPTKEKIKSQSDKYYGIDYSLDIQKYHYYPGTKKLYTFMGFSNHQLLENASKLLKQNAHHHTIFLYTQQETNQSTQDNKPRSKINFYDLYILRYNKITLPKFNEYSKSDLEFIEFKPKEDLYYLFFAEQLEPTKSILNSSYDQLYSIKKSSDIQRFCYYPKTKNIYTFIGFVKTEDRKFFMKFSNLNEYTVDNKVFAYPYSTNFDKIKKPYRRYNRFYYSIKDQRPNNNTNLNKNSDDSNLNKNSDDSNLNKNSDVSNLIKNSDVSVGPFFEPKHGLYYLRFKETNDDNRNVRYENKKLFGVDNVNDIQRGFKYRDDEDPKCYYTFFGFDNLERRASALDYLKKLRSSVDTSSIKEIKDFEFDYQQDEEAQDNEIEYVDDYDEDSNSNDFIVIINDDDYDDNDNDSSEDDDDDVDLNDDDDVDVDE